MIEFITANLSDLQIGLLGFPILLATTGLASAYGLYAAAAIVSLWFVKVSVIETRGKALEHMSG